MIQDFAIEKESHVYFEQLKAIKSHWPTSHAFQVKYCFASFRLSHILGKSFPATDIPAAQQFQDPRTLDQRLKRETERSPK